MAGTTVYTIENMLNLRGVDWRDFENYYDPGTTVDGAFVLDGFQLVYNPADNSFRFDPPIDQNDDYAADTLPTAVKAFIAEDAAVGTGSFFASDGAGGQIQIDGPSIVVNVDGVDKTYVFAGVGTAEIGHIMVEEGASLDDTTSVLYLTTPSYAPEVLGGGYMDGVTDGAGGYSYFSADYEYQFGVAQYPLLTGPVRTVEALDGLSTTVKTYGEDAAFDLTQSGYSRSFDSLTTQADDRKLSPDGNSLLDASTASASFSYDASQPTGSFFVDYNGNPVEREAPRILVSLDGAPPIAMVVAGQNDASLLLVREGDTVADGIEYKAIVVGAGGVMGERGTTGNPVTVLGQTLPCFAAGTPVLTADGEKRVEDVKVGDVMITASGAAKTVTWVGSAPAFPRRHPRPWEVHPVRVKAHAFGDNMPARDVRLSPGHAVFVDGVLIPVGQLVNGATIVQEEVNFVRYYHVELESHDVLLANGLPCESYLDDGNRSTFANADEAIALHGRLDPKSWDDACAPMVAAGPQLETVQRRLHARAAALGWTKVYDADLCVNIGGQTIRPTLQSGGRYWFVLPAGGAITLNSNASRLSQAIPGVSDKRRLGVAITEVRVNGVSIELESDAFGKGFYRVERRETSAWRWTDGAAHLALPDQGASMLELSVSMMAPKWERATPLRLVASA